MNGFNNQNSNYLDSNTKKEPIINRKRHEDTIISPATSIEDFEPIKNELKSQIDKKLHPKFVGSNRIKNVTINGESRPEDVKKFLTVREFSQKYLF